MAKHKGTRAAIAYTIKNARKLYRRGWNRDAATLLQHAAMMRYKLSDKLKRARDAHHCYVQARRLERIAGQWFQLVDRDKNAW